MTDPFRDTLPALRERAHELQSAIEVKRAAVAALEAELVETDGQLRALEGRGKGRSKVLAATVAAAAAVFLAHFLHR